MVIKNNFINECKHEKQGGGEQCQAKLCLCLLPVANGQITRMLRNTEKF